MGEHEGGAGDVADFAGAGGMCWRVRQRLLSSAKPRSPRQRGERSSALRVRVLISRSRSSAGCLAGMWMPMPAPSYPVGLEYTTVAVTCLF